MTRSQDHSQCSSHVVQGELLPKIDDEIDNVLGLAVFYQYVRTAALNQQQQTQHVSVFTTELFANYLHIRCLTITKYRQFTQKSSSDKVHRYRKCFYRFQEILIADVLLLNFLNKTKCPTNDQSQIVVIGQTMPVISHQLDTSRLVELLQQFAVDRLSTFRQLEAQELSSFSLTVTTDFEALYAYKCGEYQRCLQLSTHNVQTMSFVFSLSARVFAYPEFIQLMDDDIVSLIGLISIVNRGYRNFFSQFGIRQLTLSAYLMAQCQMKLHHSVTSLTQTLHYIEDARTRDKLTNYFFTLERLSLQLIERKLLLYIGRPDFA